MGVKMEIKNDRRIRRYSIDSPELMHLRTVDEQMDFVIQLIGDLEYWIDRDPFIHFMNTIIGQMLSNKVADIISDRFLNLCNGSITPEAVCRLSVEDLRSIGLSRDKSGYLLGFAQYIYDNPQYFDELETLPDKELLSSLQKHRGIAGWSSKMYAIFVLDRKDILPFEDGAFLQSFRWLYGVDEKNRNHPIIRKMCEKWSPYSSLAARYLYRVLDNGYVKRSVEEVKQEIHFSPIRG